VNPIDIVAVALVIVALLLGFRSGALPQLGGLLGAIGGGALVILALPALADPLAEIEPEIRPLLVLVGLLLAVGLGESIGSSIGSAMARRLGGGVLGAADRVGGGFVGIGQALLIIWLAGGLLAIGPLPRLTEAAQGSTAVRALNSVLPPPESFAEELGALLDASGLPDVFIGLEPLPRPSVERPTDAVTRAIGALAEESTYRITAAACGQQVSGSGVVVARGYIVTNAHVVAGASDRGVRVADASGDQSDAVVVRFDPDLDIAVLYAPDVRARSLDFAVVDPERGAIGAALGYPGGGPLTILPAAVTGAYPGTGRDIYDEGTVRRDLLELQSAIDQGDSGGPFVLADGTIGGIVFAEARSNPDIGYALAARDVDVAVAPAIGRTSPVDTGPCLEH
jgi:S1-C subfamily serine protease